MKFYPYEKGGRKSFSHSEGGAQKVLGLFLRGSLKFKPYCRGGALSFHSLKWGARKVLPCREGGAQKVSDPRFSHFVAPPSL